MAGGIMAALDGTQEPFTPGPPKPDELTEMVQLGVKTWNKQIEDEERALKTEQYIRSFCDAHGPELDRLQKPPSEKALKQYAQAWNGFQRWANNDGLQGFPHSAVVASYLSVLMLAQRPMREIKEAVRAIKYHYKVQQKFLDDDFITITLRHAAEHAALWKGDGYKPNGNGAVH